MEIQVDQLAVPYWKEEVLGLNLHYVVRVMVELEYNLEMGLEGMCVDEVAMPH